MAKRINPALKVINQINNKLTKIFRLSEQAHNMHSKIEDELFELDWDIVDAKEVLKDMKKNG